MKKALNVITLFAFLFAGATFASPNSPIGKWKTIDDETHKVKSIVSIWQDGNGKLRGKIEEIFPDPGEDPDPVCDKCEPEDPRYNKRIIGMEIMNGFTRTSPNNPSEWEEGEILDPDNGKVYSCNLTVDASGKSLEVRGYIGFSWIGRSQTWVRLTE